VETVEGDQSQVILDRLRTVI